ncbi:MAG TPA: Ig-like domain-containing protein [Gemmataceae bacterium]|nr:Ig-like domain-containing protein [Gemmataceae bacterium]
MSRRQGSPSVRLVCERLEDRATPAAVWQLQTFDSVALGQIPTNWSQWSNEAGTSFGVDSTLALNGTQSLSSAGDSVLAARAWSNAVLPADFGVFASVYVNSLQPVQLFVRGQNLNSAQPSYYAVSIQRGVQISLLKVVNGQTTVLATLTSKSYLSNQWVRVTLQPSGQALAVEVLRLDTQQYLNGSGNWQAGRTVALQASDGSIGADGLIGINRPAAYSGKVSLDDFTILVPEYRQNFDAVALGTLPNGWSQWSNNSSGAFQASNQQSLSAPQSLASTAATSQTESRTWLSTPYPPDVQVSAAVYLNGLNPAEIFARGSNLNTATPSYYALAITRGLQIQLLRVVNGAATVLQSLSSSSYVANQWIKLSLRVIGNQIQAVVYNPITQQYLNSSGNWQAQFTIALTCTDTAISGMGLVGIERPAKYAGAVYFDDFAVTSAFGDTEPPVVTLVQLTSGNILSGTTTIQANLTDGGGIDHVDFLIDGQLRFSTAETPSSWTLDTTGLSNGAHTLLVRAYDLGGNVGSRSASFSVQNWNVPLPIIPKHYSNIRMAELAYSGTPVGSFEQQLIQNSVDLVVSDSQYLALVHSISPNTPQLIYTNFSNLYGPLLLDWLNYANANGLNPEDAFYHVTVPTSFTGASASSQPVNWFWYAARGNSLTSLTNLTSAAHDTTLGDVTLGSLGQSLYLGYPAPFREINVNLSQAAASGWKGVLEYASGVDANGTPTNWKPLTLIKDGTNGFAQSGQITFDPPTDWTMAQIGSQARMYFVRIRTISGGTAPAATTILGRDYVSANGASHGTIPVFDYAADADHDGYLNDAEYANRTPGDNARFAYESRLFYPYYGQMRFVLNPSNGDVQQWAASYAARLLTAQPFAAGLFVDNSSGHSPLAGFSVAESTSSYSTDYASMLGGISTQIAPQWLMANTSGGGSETDAVIRNTAASFQESAIRALASGWQQFEDLANTVAHRQALTTPAHYMILDSMTTGGSPTDARTQLATLAYYYLIADPATTFLNYAGGQAPNTSWTQHWIPAAGYNIGQPAGKWSLFASGKDPANSALTYHVYQRAYTNALVLYKPLSYATGVGTGSLADATATTFQLNGTYHLLQSDGTLSSPVTSVTLRNGEGAILVKAG